MERNIILVKGYAEHFTLTSMEKLYFIHDGKAYESGKQKISKYFKARKWYESKKSIEEVRKLEFIGHYVKPINQYKS